MAKKLVPTVAVTVVRDGKRVTRTPQMGSFAFTSEEVEQITAVMPTAFRKPVNEDTGTDETAPEHKAGATATTDPKPSAKKKAAQKDSQSAAATQADTGSGEPKDTDNGGSDDAAGEDDDI